MNIIKKNMNIKVKIFLSTIIAFLIIIICNNVYAASASLKAQQTKLEPGQSTSITVSVSATEAWNLKLTTSGGTLSGTTSNADSAGSEVSKDVINATFTASQEGKYTITLSGEVTGSDLVKQEVKGKNITINVEKPTPVVPDPKPEPTPNPEPQPEPEPKPTELEFTTVNETIYATGKTNVRSSYEISSDNIIGSLSKGESATRTGISKQSSGGYKWSKITYNGKTAYVVSSNVTTTEPKQEEKPIEEPADEPKQEEPNTTIADEPEKNDTVITEGLKTLEIQGITLSPEFKSDVYEYTGVLKTEITTLEISAVTVNDNDKVVIAGNDDIKEGENVVIINVYNAKSQVKATYQIKVYKNTLDLTTTDKILQEANKLATIKLYAVITLFILAIVVLVIVLIIKHKKEYEQYEEDDYYDNFEEKDNNKEAKIIEQQEEVKQDNIFEKAKRKGKHF